MNKYRALFLSHGGGPMPLLGDEGHQEMVHCLEQIAAKIDKARAIVVVSAHWEETSANVTASAMPDLYYDYYGFPAESYNIDYACKGHPELAAKIQSALQSAGIQSQLDLERGLDHGVFVPLKIMYPQADIPCIQLSLFNSLDPTAHIALGKALRDVLTDDVLLIGSGFSFHNMRAFFQPDTAQTKALNHDFEQWLLDTCANKAMSETEREQTLIDWQSAPGARFCHPREEHLLPLHVCYGFTQSACRESVELNIFNKKASMYLW
ncbi:DODA-type extradiol aromatic ring-opening family dioxygenase [Neptunicella marina]|uniref:Dioxygenase n=1 Tax=Neptunicella marina TaxID=2125989 RepID=A0A8J6IRA9_9ALTE|nr:class III extradiol ring-cleavage dioxygenase [Neptunicella marina]MBC3766090.1 dioxygenase [Neptunicella marina]